MIRWGPPDRDDLAPPAAICGLLLQAIAARPANPALRVKLAEVLVDRYDFAGAAEMLEAALALDTESVDVRRRLGRCCNALRRHQDALDALGPVAAADYERALALLGLGRDAEAEAELGELLAVDPHHRPALRRLGKLLRRSGRIAELVETCETLSARGAGHAQLLYVWGTALALAGRDDEARAILLDRERIAELTLPVPAGFDDLAGFNEALAEEILTNPYRLGDFPAEDEANRGSSRVHALFAGRRPELVRALLDALQQLVAGHAPARRDGFDPWADARPGAAHLKAWGLIQRGGDYEEWHSHPGGWLSGVYYVHVPDGVTAEGPGGGCIEFGPPTALARARPDLVPVWRHAPRPGKLLLAPSHYAHRTIPTGADAHRISFAFDVVPDG